MDCEELQKDFLKPAYKKTNGNKYKDKHTQRE